MACKFGKLKNPIGRRKCKAKKKGSRRTRRRAAASTSRASGSCCPVVHLKCSMGSDFKKRCTVKVGNRKASRKMSSGKAGAMVARIVQAQKKARCLPMVKSR